MNPRRLSRPTVGFGSGLVSFQTHALAHDHREKHGSARRITWKAPSLYPPTNLARPN